MNQIELHPWLPHRDIIQWCKENGVLVQAWAPLVQGERWGDKILRGISERTGKSEAQVLLRWSLQKVSGVLAAAAAATADSGHTGIQSTP